MPKPYSTPPAKGRRHIGNAHRLYQGSELTSERRQQLALNRFTYSGGFDGFEGRMILSRMEADGSDRKK
ncbi:MULTISPECIES: hypothetical protein [Methylorubrum]|jgi:hypothetical protein|uniref:Uncharacterized protein n=3 Tax=Methylorubrum extorquens TaxID=408 RepID=B7KVG3_METC4|nr:MULTISPECIES: hypothetical protein [Methylorubrum]KQQ15389.1 hypothetical protein ASF59_16415 [Methylobacterium sp. Leaf121]ACK84371.1 conserved hypothetical protein [Methylorubrum extorquens CM4]ARO56863.1 hypothetical protein B2G69_23700 [Methylorubrum zatmanii]MCP1537655.1 hypothetical protein [Methylorubrum extorquens]MCY1642898.1 hypothetical protein [Methylorubrum sp. SL192]